MEWLPEDPQARTRNSTQIRQNHASLREEATHPALFSFKAVAADP